MFNRTQRRRGRLLLSLAPLLLSAGPVAAQTLSDTPHFIGPLASGAPPLPKGAGNIEPYLVNTRVNAVFDGQGNRHGVDSPSTLGAIIPMTYGLTDDLTVGATLRGSQDRGDNTLAPGDTTLSAQYGLYNGEDTHRVRVHASVRQTLDTGRHDQLGRRDGTGSGARPTALSLGTQAYFLDGHLRARAVAGWRLPGSHAQLRDRSVYGTADGFVGTARLGSSFTLSSSVEYSVAPQWTLVGEVLHSRAQGARVRGVDAAGAAVDTRAANSWSTSVLPAVQYHVSDRIGVIAGAELTVAGRNTSVVVAPQVAVNIAF